MTTSTPITLLLDDKDFEELITKKLKSLAKIFLARLVTDQIETSEGHIPDLFVPVIQDMMDRITIDYDRIDELIQAWATIMPQAEAGGHIESDVLYGPVTADGGRLTLKYKTFHQHMMSEPLNDDTSIRTILTRDVLTIISDMVMRKSLVEEYVDEDTVTAMKASYTALELTVDDLITPALTD